MILLAFLLLVMFTDDFLLAAMLAIMLHLGGCV